MLHTKFGILGMYTVWDMVPSMQEYCVHAHWLACLNLGYYAVPSSIYGLKMVPAKFESPSMYTAWDMVLSMQEYSVYAH